MAAVARLSVRGVWLTAVLGRASDIPAIHRAHRLRSPAGRMEGSGRGGGPTVGKDSGRGGGGGNRVGAGGEAAGRDGDLLVAPRTGPAGRDADSVRLRRRAF